jgi:hypothetical protein
MKEESKKRLYDTCSVVRNNAVSILCVILAVSLLAAPVASQVATDREDTFEDNNSDGWQGQNFNVQPVSIEGSYSLEAENNVDSQSDNPTWEDGPNLDLSKEFTVTGTSKIQQTSSTRAGFGIVRQSADGNAEGVILIFSSEYGSTFIATENLENPNDNGLETINRYYDNTWVNWELNNDGTGNISAKVWEVGNTEPSTYQINRQLSEDSGKFSIFAGIGSESRTVNLDSVRIQGTTAPEPGTGPESDPTLKIETGNYLNYDSSQEYAVYDVSGNNDVRNEVTNQATVTSENTSIVTIDTANNQVESTSNESVEGKTFVKATYDGRESFSPVTVAEPSIDNLDILPFLYRVSAMFLDRGFQMILVSLLLSVAATRTGGVFAGLGIYQLSLTSGWLIGWVPIGLALVGLFTTLFIGLNIAANINYTSMSPR